MVQLEEPVLLHKILLGILIKDHLRHTVAFPLKYKFINEVSLKAVPADSVCTIKESSPHICLLLPKKLHLL